MLSLSGVPSLRPQQEFEVIKHILLRERYLKQLQQACANASTSARMTPEVVRCLDLLRVATVECVEAIDLWEQAQVDYPQVKPFYWNGVSYLVKLRSDLKEFDGYEFLTTWLDFGLEDNPMILRPDMLQEDIQPKVGAIYELGGVVPPPMIESIAELPKLVAAKIQSPYRTAVINDPNFDPSRYKLEKRVWRSRKGVTVVQPSKQSSVPAIVIPATILDSFELTRAIAAWRFVELATSNTRLPEGSGGATQQFRTPTGTDFDYSSRENFPFTGPIPIDLYSMRLRKWQAVAGSPTRYLDEAKMQSIMRRVSGELFALTSAGTVGRTKLSWRKSFIRQIRENIRRNRKLIAEISSSVNHGGNQLAEALLSDACEQQLQGCKVVQFQHRVTKPGNDLNGVPTAQHGAASSIQHAVRARLEKLRVEQNEQLVSAISLLQAQWRGQKPRHGAVLFRAYHKAARRIQSCWRRVLATRATHRVYHARQQLQAALIIQRVFRGSCSRKRSRRRTAMLDGAKSAWRAAKQLTVQHLQQMASDVAQLLHEQYDAVSEAVAGFLMPLLHATDLLTKCTIAQHLAIAEPPSFQPFHFLNASAMLRKPRVLLRRLRALSLALSLQKPIPLAISATTAAQVNDLLATDGWAEWLMQVNESERPDLEGLRLLCICVEGLFVVIRHHDQFLNYTSRGMPNWSVKLRAHVRNVCVAAAQHAYYSAIEAQLNTTISTCANSPMRQELHEKCSDCQTKVRTAAAELAKLSQRCEALKQRVHREDDLARSNLNQDISLVKAALRTEEMTYEYRDVRRGASNLGTVQDLRMSLADKVRQLDWITATQRAESAFFDLPEDFCVEDAKLDELNAALATASAHEIILTAQVNDLVRSHLRIARMVGNADVFTKLTTGRQQIRALQREIHHLQDQVQSRTVETITSHFCALDDKRIRRLRQLRWDLVNDYDGAVERGEAVELSEGAQEVVVESSPVSHIIRRTTAFDEKRVALVFVQHALPHWAQTEVIQALEGVVVVKKLNRSANLETVMSTLQELPAQSILWLDLEEHQGCIPWGPILDACGVMATGIVLGSSLGEGADENANMKQCANLGKVFAKQRDLVNQLTSIFGSTAHRHFDADIAETLSANAHLELDRFHTQPYMSIAGILALLCGQLEMPEVGLAPSSTEYEHATSWLVNTLKHGELPTALRNMRLQALGPSYHKAVRQIYDSDFMQQEMLDCFHAPIASHLKLWIRLAIGAYARSTACTCDLASLDMVHVSISQATWGAVNDTSVVASQLLRYSRLLDRGFQVKLEASLMTSICISWFVSALLQPLFLDESAVPVRDELPPDATIATAQEETSSLLKASQKLTSSISQMFRSKRRTTSASDAMETDDAQSNNPEVADVQVNAPESALQETLNHIDAQPPTSATIYNAVPCHKFRAYASWDGVFVEGIMDGEFSKFWAIPFSLMDTMKLEVRSAELNSRFDTKNETQSALHALFEALKVSYDSGRHRIHCCPEFECILETTLAINGYQTQIQVLRLPNNDLRIVAAAYASRFQQYSYHEIQLSDAELFACIDFGDDVHDLDFMLHAFIAVLTIRPNHGLLEGATLPTLKLTLKQARRRHEGALLWRAVLPAAATIGNVVVTARTMHEAYDPDVDGYLSIQLYERSTCQSTIFQISKQEFTVMGFSADADTLRQELLCRIVATTTSHTSSNHQALLSVGDGTTQVVFIRDPGVRRIGNFTVSASAESQDVVLHIFHPRNLRAWSTKISSAAVFQAANLAHEVLSSCTIEADQEREQWFNLVSSINLESPSSICLSPSPHILLSFSPFV